MHRAVVSMRERVLGDVVKKGRPVLLVIILGKASVGIEEYRHFARWVRALSSGCRRLRALREYTVVSEPRWRLWNYARRVKVSPLYFHAVQTQLIGIL